MRGFGSEVRLWNTSARTVQVKENKLVKWRQIALKDIFLVSSMTIPPGYRRHTCSGHGTLTAGRSRVTGVCVAWALRLSELVVQVILLSRIVAIAIVDDRAVRSSIDARQELQRLRGML